MKRLTLLRHAKSLWDDPVARDFDRPLNAKGHRAGRTVGEEMQRLGLSFDAVVASPAARVIETLEEVAQGFGSPLTPRFDHRIYLASLEALIEVLHSVDDEIDSLLLVGHSPGLERLALYLAGVKDKPLRRSVEAKYPTGALIEINLPVDRWRDADEGGGTMTRFLRPRDLDPALGPEFS
jgi:phosphohistidine phosphatase